MSAQSAKKKRMGSRRRVANQNKTPEADEFHITDSTSIPQHCIPEENTESFNPLANPHTSQSKTPNPPTPELSMNRRKLGSSRRSKGGEHVKDSATESYHKPREEVEEKIKCNETPKTPQMPLAIKLQGPEVLSQGSEHVIMSATHSSSLYSAISSDNSFKVQCSTTKNCPETELDGSIPKSENLQTDQDKNDTDYKVMSESCKLVEIVPGETDKPDTLQSEDLKENEHCVGISELTTVSILSYPSVDQQLIEQSSSREMPDEEIGDMYSVIRNESRERDDDTELLRQDGNLHGSFLVSESHVKSVVKPFSTTPEKTTDKSSPRENTKHANSVEQETFSPPNEKLPKDEEQSEHYNLTEVQSDQHSDDFVNEVHEQEVQQTEMYEIEYSENVTHDATEISEIISGNLINQDEVSDRNQVIVKSTDNSTKQEDSNPGDKHDLHPTKENNFESLEQTSEDYLCVCDNKKLQIIDTEIVESSLGQVYEIEDQAKDDVKPSSEQTGHQEREGIISEIEESESSLQTLQSETGAPLDSQPLDNAVRTEEQTHTGFNRIENRRKLGSSRRNKGRQLVKGSVAESHHEQKKEVVDSTPDNEALETMQMLVAIERTHQEELSQGSEHDIVMPVTYDSSLYSVIMHDSSEVQSSTTPTCPETDLESSSPKSENLQEDDDKKETDFRVEVSDKSGGTTQEGMSKSDTQEVRDTHHSEDAVNKVHEQEVKTHEIYHSSDNVTHDATENSGIISGNPTDKAEVSDTNQSDLVVKSTDDSSTKQEDSNPDDKHYLHPTRESGVEALGPTNEDYHVYDTKKLEISGIENLNTESGQVYEIKSRVEDDIKPHAEQTGLFSEMEENDSSLHTDMQAPLELQPQESDTHFKLIGNRRKLGSSRRNKGKQHAEDSMAKSYHRPAEDDVLNTRGNDTLEKTKMSIETAVQEKVMETTLEGMDTLDTAHTGEIGDHVNENGHVGTLVGISLPSTSSLHSSSTVDQQLTDQSSSTKMPEEELSSLNFVTESKDGDEGTKLLRQDGNLQDKYFASESHLKSENIETSVTSEIFTEKSSPGEHAGIKCTVEQLALSSSQEELSLNEEQQVNVVRGSLHSEEVVNEVCEKAAWPTQMQEMHEIDFSVKESESSLQTLQSEINSHLGFQDNSVRIEEKTHTGFHPIENRRKLGSSRRNKGRQLVKDCGTETYHKPKEEFAENTRGDDVLEVEDASQVQTTGALSCDSLAQNINMQQTNDDMEMVGDVTVKDHTTEAKSTMDGKVFGQDEVGQKFEHPTKKDHEVQEIHASQEMTKAELFSVTHNKNGTLFDLTESVRGHSAVDVPEESGISTAVGKCNSQQAIQETTLLDNRENLHKSEHKRGKMGSTHLTQLSREQAEGIDNKDETKESYSDKDAGKKKIDKIEVVEEIPVKFVHEADIRDSERNVDIIVEPVLPDDFTGTEIHITSVVTARNAANPGITGESFVPSFETTQSVQNSRERPESVGVIQDQAMTSADAPVVAVADLEIENLIVRGGTGEKHRDAQVSIKEPNNMIEGAQNKNLEMKNASPNSNSARRRKMGSTRRNLGLRSEGEDSHQKREVANEATEAATNVGDVKTESFTGVNEKEELQLYIEAKDSDSEQRKEKVIETVEYSHTGESHFKPSSHQTFEENMVSHGHLVETEDQLTPSYFPTTPSTSPKHDVISETAGGRRRKLGSHRKSRGHQSNENQTAREDRITDTQNRRDVKTIIDESGNKTTEDESLHLDKISEVDESDKKPSSDISSSKSGEHSRPVSEKTPVQVTLVQLLPAEIRPGQQSQNTFSLGSSTGAALRSNAYNVMMVGDSSVGKTSFMKRTQSGKFSLDLPASVGLDSCMCTMVVDEKHVVLQLWDTAGQERFHSITRQIFHKAQAFLLMYDITSSQSFSAVRYWVNCIEEGAAENVTILLLGNKSDHAERQVPTQDGENLAKEFNFEFMECSAATGENVIQSLETVARMLSQKPDTREENPVLHKESQQKKSSGCC